VDWAAGSIDERFTPYVTIGGIGPTGLRKRSVQADRVPSERRWIVNYFDGTRSTNGHEKRTIEDLGPFSSATLAARSASLFAASREWPLSPYAKAFLHQGSGQDVNITSSNTEVEHLEVSDKPYIQIIRLKNLKESKRASKLLNVSNMNLWIVALEILQDGKHRRRPQYKLIPNLGVFKTAKTAQEAACRFARQNQYDIFC